MNDNLWNAPPRICDLPREEMQQRLFQRHAQHKANWLRDRAHRPWWRRLADRWAASG